MADIVNAMVALDTTQVWGDASTSSSDGQRFLFPRRVLQRPYSHRLGDFALEFYTFITDNYAPFYTVSIECSERDAPYVLDGLLHHEPDIDPQEHYTDTHGYVELNFAAFPMFGKRFCPRIRACIVSGFTVSIRSKTTDRLCPFNTLAPLPSGSFSGKE